MDLVSERKTAYQSGYRLVYVSVCRLGCTSAMGSEAKSESRKEPALVDKLDGR